MSLLYQDAAKALCRDYISYDFASWLEFSRTPIAETYPKVHTVKYAICVPEIIALQKYDRLPDREIKLSRQSIIQRDDNKCIYCGKSFSTKDLTIDHIVPKSRGGTNNYDNLASCCKRCNFKKSNFLLSELGWKPLFKPTKPKWINPITQKVGKEHQLESWKHFLNKANVDIGDNNH